MPLGYGVNGGVEPLKGVPGGQSPHQIALGMMQIDPEKLRAIIAPLFVTLDATTTSGYSQYRVPTTHDLIIEKILPHIVLLDLANEVATVVAGVTPASIADRMAMKAMNCLIDLQNTDRTQKIIDNASASLASMFGPAGGEPVDFGATPHKVPAGETLRFDARLGAVGTAAGNVAAGKAQYGIVIVGKLVRVAKS